ncbi:MAG: LamG domain-containing protein [Candidatus Anstonellaceae archaeon]
MCKISASMKGAFLSLDSAVATLTIFAAIMFSFSLLSIPSNFDPSAQFLDAYLQDTASVLAKRGSLNEPLLSNSSNFSGIMEVLMASPDSICEEIVVFCNEVPNGLQAYWKLDESFGPFVADSSGNGYTGIKIGFPNSTMVGQAGKAVQFSGSNYISTSFDSSWNDAMLVTWSFWIKPDDVSANGGIIGKPYDAWEWAFYHEGNSVGLYYFDQSRGDSNGMSGGWGSVLSEGQWTHLAYVWDGRFSRFYVNGEEVSSFEASNPSFNQDSAEGVLIGGNLNYKGENLYFRGQIDDVRAYNRALSPNEIRRLYSNPYNVAYSIRKTGCYYSAGQIRSHTIPISRSFDQSQNDLCYAVLKAWLKGDRVG